MKNKLKLLMLLPLLFLTGCNEEGGDDTGKPSVNPDTIGFTELCNHKLTFGSSYLYFFKANDTELIYTLVICNYNSGCGTSFNPYYNEDGLIMNYTEFRQVHPEH